MAAAKRIQFILWCSIVAIVLVLWINRTTQKYRQVEPLAFRALLTMLEDGRQELSLSHLARDTYTVADIFVHG